MTYGKTEEPMSACILGEECVADQNKGKRQMDSLSQLR